MSVPYIAPGGEPVTIRAATEADLPAIGDIYYRAEVADAPSPPPPHPFAWQAHTLATGQLFVAESRDAIVGYSGRLVRGDVAFLTDLFVRVAQQSSAIGKALLAVALPSEERLLHCTMSSTDPRAQALYTRAGMRPQWPNFWLRGFPGDLRPLPEPAVRAVESALDDPDLFAWDARISGRPRPQDFAYWRASTQATGIWFERDGARVGYGVVQARTDASVYYPQGFTVGPIGATSEADAAACVLAAIAWACARAQVVRIPVPGAHGALKPLLDAGFKIVYVETFCSSAVAPPFDPTRYLTSGDLL